MEKLRMGILACGGIAGVMAETIRHMEPVEMTAVGARDYGRAKEFADKYGFKRAYGSYEELVEDGDVELVYIASPHSHHYEHIKLCLEHGKHVLCEKAFTANAAQAEEVLKLAEGKGLLLTEAMWVRYMPMCRTLQEVIASGVIGGISTLTANLHYVIDGNERIYRPELAGGALLDVGVYALTFASVCFGDDVERITSDAVMFDTGVDAQSTVILTYRDGKVAVCTGGTRGLSDRQGILYGRKGYIVVENINNFESIKVYNTDRELVKRYDAPAQISGYEYEVESCLKAIRAGKTECEEMPHAQTLLMMKRMDGIREALKIRYPFE